MSYDLPCAYGDTLVKYGGASVTWNKLRYSVNKLLQEHKIAEDKFVGPYMISPAVLTDREQLFEDLFAYLWNDVLKTRAPLAFGNAGTLTELRRRWLDQDAAILGNITPLVADAEGEDDAPAE